jgi:hypothetical protein
MFQVKRTNFTQKQPFMLQKTKTKKTRKRKSVESRKSIKPLKRLAVQVFKIPVILQYYQIERVDCKLIKQKSLLSF